MLQLVARTVTEPRRTVLLLEWSRGKVLALHEDGELHEYRLSEVRCDRMESVGRIALNQQQNQEMFSEAAERPAY